MAKNALKSSPKATKTVTPELTQRPAPATPPSVPSKDLQVFPNPAPGRDYVIFNGSGLRKPASRASVEDRKSVV